MPIEERIHIFERMEKVREVIQALRDGNQKMELEALLCDETFNVFDYLWLKIRDVDTSKQRILSRKQTAIDLASGDGDLINSAFDLLESDF